MVRLLSFLRAMVRGEIRFRWQTWWWFRIFIYALLIVLVYTLLNPAYQVGYAKFDAKYKKMWGQEPPPGKDGSKPQPASRPWLTPRFAASPEAQALHPKNAVLIITPVNGEDSDSDRGITPDMPPPPPQKSKTDQNPKPGSSQTDKDKPTPQNDKETAAKPKKPTLLDDIKSILVIYALVLGFWSIWRLRRQTVVEDFTIYEPSSQTATTDPRGLGSLLANELESLGRLFQTVDEQRAVSTAPGVQRNLEAAFKGQAPKTLFDEADLSASDVKLGPLALPVGKFMAFLGRMLQGPRLVGSLHVEKIDQQMDRYTLAARWVGGDKPFSWEVAKEFPRPAGDNPKLPPGESVNTTKDPGAEMETTINVSLIRELAYRIFTDLALSPKVVRWEATKALRESLRAYRSCLRTAKDATLNLKRAEHYLMEAISIDGDMSLAYYNLGVVYTELERGEAAIAAFTKATELDKDFWEPAYGLAREYYNKMNEVRDYQSTFNQVMNWCERVKKLQPDNAKVLNLQGRTHLKKAINLLSSSHDSECQEAVTCLEQAVKLAWKSFRKEITSGKYASGKYASIADREAVRQRYETFLVCLHNLATAHLESADNDPDPEKREIHYQQADKLLNEAFYFQKHAFIKMESLQAPLYHAQGRTDLGRHRYKDALDNFDQACRIDPAVPLYWAWQAIAKAVVKGQDTTGIEAVIDHFLNALPKDETNRLNLLQKIKKHIEKYPAAKNHLKRLTELEEFLQEINKKKQGENFDHYLEVKYLSLEKEKDKAWELAQVALELYKFNFQKRDWQKAITNCQAALEALKSNYFQEARRQKLKPWLAYCQRFEQVRRCQEIRPPGGLEEVPVVAYEKVLALKNINEALTADPLSPALRRELGCAYFHLEQFAEAGSALEDALFWDPDDPEIYHYLGCSYFGLVNTRPDLSQGSQRKEGLAKAGEYFDSALTLYNEKTKEKGWQKSNGNQEKTKSLENHRKIGLTHYWRGKVYLELNQPGPAIPHLLMASNLQQALEEEALKLEALEQEALALKTLEMAELQLENLELEPQIVEPPEMRKPQRDLLPEEKIPADTNLQLGLAYLKNKQINAAENLFQQVIDRYKAQAEKSELSDEEKLALAQVRLHFAFSLTERGGGFRGSQQVYH